MRKNAHMFPGRPTTISSEYDYLIEIDAKLHSRVHPTRYDVEDQEQIGFILIEYNFTPIERQSFVVTMATSAKIECQ